MRGVLGVVPGRRNGECMITFILIGLVAILAIGLGVMVWNNGARKRSDQAQVTSANSASGETKIGRATGPD